MGVKGVKGTASVKWYRAKSNDMPGFVACQACYEDRVLNTRFAADFEPTQPQAADDTWACDLAVPFIEKEYEARESISDWPNFVAETKARMSMKVCPQRRKTLSHGKKWFIPKNGPEELVLCAACYCDQVIHTGEEAKRKAVESWTREYDKYVKCATGVFSMKMAMASGHEFKDFSVFWTAVDKLSREKYCDDVGVEDGIWYTLPSNPNNFGVCARCYVAIAEPLHVSQFFVRKPDTQPAGTKWQYCFSVAHPRFKQFVQRLLETYYTRDSTSFDKFASAYASMPMCPRDQDAQDKHWYGWMNCTRCQECYYEFAQHSPLASQMQLRNNPLEGSTMCELYSPRMRNLFKECSEASPLDPQPLFEYSVQRRLVWMQTVRQIRMMLFRAKMALNQQRFLNVTSSYYNQADMLQEITMPSAHTYGMAGVGYGYVYNNLLQGAIYGQQAMQCKSARALRVAVQSGSWGSWSSGGGPLSRW